MPIVNELTIKLSCTTSNGLPVFNYNQLIRLQKISERMYSTNVTGALEFMDCKVKDLNERLQSYVNVTLTKYVIKELHFIFNQWLSEREHELNMGLQNFVHG